MIPKPLDKISSLKKYRICSVILKRNKLLCLFEKSGLQFPHSATHYLYSQVILINKKRKWVQCWSDCVIINKIFADLINLMSISFTETNRKLEMRCWRQKAFACIANVWDSELIKLVKFYSQERPEITAYMICIALLTTWSLNFKVTKNEWYGNWPQIKWVDLTMIVGCNRYDSWRFFFLSIEQIISRST